MTYEELMLNYHPEVDDEQMKLVTSIVSDFIEKSTLNDKETLLRKIYGVVGNGHYDRCFAERQIADMYYLDNSNTKHYAPYWTEGELKTLYDSLKESIKPYNFYDFAVVMNMVKSDQYRKLKKWFPSATEDELLDKFVDEAVTWLDDPDSPCGSTKVWYYFNH